MKIRYLVFLVVFVTFQLTACSKALGSSLPYKIEGFNLGAHGILLQAPKVGPQNSAPLPYRIYPDESLKSQPKPLLYFSDYLHQLPSRTTFKWKLTNAKSWTPISSKVYSQQVDIAAAAKSAKRRDAGYAGVTPNCLLIRLIFKEDKLRVNAVKVHYGGTDPVHCYGSVSVGE